MLLSLREAPLGEGLNEDFRWRRSPNLQAGLCLGFLLAEHIFCTDFLRARRKCHLLRPPKARSKYFYEKGWTAVESETRFGGRTGMWPQSLILTLKFNCRNPQKNMIRKSAVSHTGREMYTDLVLYTAMKRRMRNSAVEEYLKLTASRKSDSEFSPLLVHEHGSFVHLKLFFSIRAVERDFKPQFCVGTSTRSTRCFVSFGRVVPS